MDKIDKATILVVDDDQGIRDLLGRYFQQHHFDVLLAADGREMSAQLSQSSVDLIVLDVMLPEQNGVDLCRKLRETSSVPIIMLTAVSEELDRILALEVGADDYLGKPFNPRELLARVKAVLRRAQNDAPTVAEASPAYVFAGWRLDTGRRELCSPDGVNVTLSSGEYQLLVAFCSQPQQVLSRDMLLDLTRSRHAMPFDRSIDIQISRLRAKIEEDPKQPQLIKTIRGGGYLFSPAVEWAGKHE